MVARILLAVLLLATGPLGAQDAPPLRLEVSAAGGGVVVRLGDVLGDEALEEALHSGLPLRVEVVTELWKDGFFDGLVGREQWQATIVLDPLVEEYLVRIGDEPSDTRRFTTPSELRDGFPRSLRPPLAPRESGRHYYTGRITVETLSLSDLDELRRWLRGELAGAVTGDREVEGAVERGLRRTVVRLLGLPSREYATRTSTFEVP